MKQVAQLGATCGAGIFYEVLCAVSSVDEETLRHALTQLVAAELLYQRGAPQARYRFKHHADPGGSLCGVAPEHPTTVPQADCAGVGGAVSRRCEEQPELLAHHYTEQWSRSHTLLAAGWPAGSRALGV